MHLKSLTLKGFKSFASATTLRFEPGITCVVGPNGSGKSNVVDALSWVMGEQGAKALRGGKMDDVIFAGTSGRAPLGRAEVTLTIDNSDGALPIEYSEVSITRRVYREGGGEYEINGKTCRLLDVQELLSDSGIGREMHVIVGQGRITSILESRPEERRAFIEEAAGVLKHRRRKEKAVRKLDSMQANLSRLTDLTTELRRHLKPLGKQAEMARRAQTVQADLRDARLRLAADDLVARRAELARGAEQEEQLRARLTALQEQVAADTEALADHQAALAGLRPEAKALEQVWLGLSGLGEQVAATVRIAVERSHSLAEEPAPYSGRDPEQLEAQAEAIALEEAELQAAAEAAAEQAEAAREERERREAVAGETERAHSEAVRAIADRREELARSAGRVETLRSRTTQIGEEIARITESVVAAEARSAQARAERDQAGSADDDADTRLAELQAARDRAAAAATAAQEAVAAARAEERRTARELVSLTARIETLEQAVAAGDGAGFLLADAETLGLRGRLLTGLTVRAGDEQAIAAALGPIADAVIAADAQAAAAALSRLRADEGGRAALVVPGADVAADAGAPPARTRWARSAVTVAGELAGPVGAVLAGTVIAEDLEAAVDAVAGGHASRAVTAEGDLLGPGWFVGGVAEADGRIAQQGRIDRAREEAAQARAAAEHATAALAEAEQAEGRVRGDADRARDLFQQAAAERAAARSQIGRLDAAVVAAETEVDRLTAQRDRVLEEQERATAELEALSARLAEQELSADGADEAGDELLGEAREEAAEALAAARAVEVEARLAQRTAEERAEAVRGRADGLRRAAEAERAARVQAERARLRKRRAAEVALEVAEQGRRVQGRIEERIAQYRARREEVDRQLAARETAEREVRARVDEATAAAARLTDAAHRDELATAKTALLIEQLEEQVAEQYAIDPESLVAEYGPEVELPPSALEIAEYEQARERGEQVVRPAPMPFDRAVQERRAKQAERDLKALGRVNPLALEEFAAMEERYEFLATQLEDVKKARADLLGVVEDVDARILQLFTEAYADVEREFVEVFATLFPGGEGRLVLTDPADMLTTGVEVEARPPGKKIRRLSLLSGGEKSLTAVAMLVAIFRARPSPFYVMDEVEAALDEVNLGRLISLFEQLRERSQLIVITHQKPTMEIADALYGVSMRGDGITQVISQRLRGIELGTSAGATAVAPAE